MSDVLFERRGHVGIVTLNRPSKRNAIDGDMARSVENAVDEIEGDPAIWVGVLAAEGDVFCAGADLSLIAQNRGSEMSTERGGWGGFVARRRTKPFIAAVDGAALAGGCELALACELIVATSRSSFGLPEVSRGLIAAAGGLFRLVRAIPRAVALEMILTGAAITASEAERWGLVNSVVSAGEALKHALGVADLICANSPVSVSAALGVALGSERRTDPDHWRETLDAIDAIIDSEDFKEGPRAFLERRKPVWTGR